MLFFQVLAVSLLLVGYSFDFAASAQRLVCYHTNWSQYRPDKGQFLPEKIDANLCTHIIYAFAKVNGDTLASIEWNDESTAWSKGMYERTIARKVQNPNLKVLLAVGGWNHGSGPFSDMANDDAARKRFVTNTVQFLILHKFDGLDLDWEYPGSRENSRPSDKQHFTSLVRELKDAFRPYGFLLTAAVAAGKPNIDAGYEVDIISQYLDWINLMAYDLHGSWETFTGQNAALYARSNEAGDQALLNVDWAVKYWISKGAPRDKLVLGMGAYGHSFKLTNPSQTGLGASAGGNPTAGTWTRESGVLSYYEICERLGQGWTKLWDNEGLVPYAHKNGEWVGYDDVESLKVKVNYVKKEGLGGAMFWALDLDDFDGNFCGQGRYPLINAVKTFLNDDSAIISTYPTSPIIPTTPKTTIIPTTPKTTIIPISPKTTTTANPSEKCYKGDGYYADKTTNCQKYYICNYTGTQYATITYFLCPNGLLFDAILTTCNYANQVTC